MYVLGGSRPSSGKRGLVRTIYELNARGGGLLAAGYRGWWRPG